MSPRVIEAIKRLASDPRTPEHERDTACLRLRELGIAVPSAPATPGRSYVMDPQPPPRPRWRPAPRWRCCKRPLVEEVQNFDGDVIAKHCARCRWVQPTTPWWQVPIYKGGERLGLTREFRQVLRRLRRAWAAVAVSPGDENFFQRQRTGWRCYEVLDSVQQWLEQDTIDWTWLPDPEPSGWRPPTEMRAAMARRAA